MPAQERNQVFISYSHEDADWLRRLQIMLRPLTRNHTNTVWDDTRINAGSLWREEIYRALATAKEVSGPETVPCKHQVKFSSAMRSRTRRW
jgi:hypothetical protein